jgi:toxin FitB
VIILDTNVLSELMNPAPDDGVRTWLDRQPESDLGTTAITVFEIRFGIDILPPGRRRTFLAEAFERAISEFVSDRVYTFDQSAAKEAALLAVRRRQAEVRKQDIMTWSSQG